MAKKDLSEIGSTGLDHYGGYLNEEKLRQLMGNKSMETFAEMADNDPTVGALLEAIDKLMRQVEWTVVPFSPSPEHQADADFLTSCMKDMDQPWSEFISEVYGAMLPFGFSPHEIVYKLRQGPQPYMLDKPPEKRVPTSSYSDGLIGWHKLAARHPTTIEKWNITDYGDIDGLWQNAPPRYQEVYIPISKLLLFRASTRKNNPQGKSILRNAFRPWYFKKKIENLEGIGIERDLAGLPMAYVPPELLSLEASPSERALLERIKTIITNVRRDEQEGVIFPMIYDENGKPLYEFKLLTTGGQRQFKTSESIERYRQDIAMTSLADFILLGHEKVGSFSLHSSKTSLFTTALGAWLQSVADVLNRKAVPQLFLVNGRPLDALPQFTYGDIEKVDLNELGAYITALTGAGISVNGPREANYLKAQANIPLDEAEQA